MLRLCIFGKPEAAEALLLPKLESDPLLAEATQWAAPPEQLVLEPQEQMIRLSRHAFRGEVWTWLGLYRNADARGSSRDGGFYGAAMLTSDGYLAGAEAMQVLLEGVVWLENRAIRNGRFSKKLSEISGTDGLSWSRMPSKGPRPGGPAPSGKQILFLDLQSAPDQSTLETLIGDLQQDRQLNNYRAVYLAHSERLAARARSARDTANVVTFTLEEYRHGQAEAPAVARTPVPAPAPPASSPPAPDRPPNEAAPSWQASQMRAIAEDVFRTEIRNYLNQLSSQRRSPIGGAGRSNFGDEGQDSFDQRHRPRRRPWLRDFAYLGTLLLTFTAALMATLGVIAPSDPQPPQPSMDNAGANLSAANETDVNGLEGGGSNATSPPQGASDGADTGSGEDGAGGGVSSGRGGEDGTIASTDDPPGALADDN